MDTIEDVIRSYVPFMHGVSSKGWNTVYCEVCGDGKRTKGPRGGWNFDGDACFYHCFNCGIDANFDPTREHPLSKGMYDVFQAFGVPAKEYNALRIQEGTGDKKSVKKKKVTLPRIETPDYFKHLTEFKSGDLLGDAAREFIWDNYHMTEDDYPFFLSTGKTESSSKDDQYRARYLRPRIIIPAYQNDHLIYWQARIFVGESDKKYVSASVENSGAVMFGLNNMFTSSVDPLYITEGFFDSWHVNGIAIITNTMADSKISILSKSNRPKIVIPDLNADGMNLANQAIELGWGVALPDILPETDICGAINRYGKLYVIHSIVNNTYLGDQARARLGFYQLENQKILTSKQ